MTEFFHVAQSFQGGLGLDCLGRNNVVYLLGGVYESVSGLTVKTPGKRAKSAS
jgi:hypothetical protein